LLVQVEKLLLQSSVGQQSRGSVRCRLLVLLAHEAAAVFERTGVGVVLHLVRIVEHLLHGFGLGSRRLLAERLAPGDLVLGQLDGLGVDLGDVLDGEGYLLLVIANIEMARDVCILREIGPALLLRLADRIRHRFPFGRCQLDLVLVENELGRFRPSLVLLPLSPSLLLLAGVVVYVVDIPLLR